MADLSLDELIRKRGVNVNMKGRWAEEKRSSPPGGAQQLATLSALFSLAAQIRVLCRVVPSCGPRTARCCWIGYVFCHLESVGAFGSALLWGLRARGVCVRPPTWDEIIEWGVCGRGDSECGSVARMWPFLDPSLNLILARPPNIGQP